MSCTTHDPLLDRVWKSLCGVGVPELDEALWHKKKILLVGDSTTRQLQEQINWEFSHRVEVDYVGARFLFDVDFRGRPNSFIAAHDLDLRRLEPSFVRRLKHADLVIMNVGIWWVSNSIGRVRDETGQWWQLTDLSNLTRDERYLREWTVKPPIPPGMAPPALDFDSLMNLALHKARDLAPVNSTLVWRSETFFDCDGRNPPGKFHVRVPGISVLNITEPTCKLVKAHPEEIEIEGGGPHLCFPSVGLRLWMQAIQQQFLLV